MALYLSGVQFTILSISERGDNTEQASKQIQISLNVSISSHNDDDAVNDRRQVSELRYLDSQARLSGCIKRVPELPYETVI